MGTSWDNTWKSIPEEAAPKGKNTEGLIGVGAESPDPLHFSGFKINPWAFHSKHFVDIKIIYCHMSSGETGISENKMQEYGVD